LKLRRRPECPSLFVSRPTRGARIETSNSKVGGQ
jgi:hypothetical protein